MEPPPARFSILSVAWLAAVNEPERVVLSQIVRKCIILRSRKHGKSENLTTAVPTEFPSSLDEAPLETSFCFS